MAKLVKAKKWDRKIGLVDGRKAVTSDTAQDKFDAETPKVVLPFVLKECFIMYLQHQAGGQPKMEPKYKGDNEYPVQILVTEKILKQLKKYHKKISYKEYNAAQFKKQFKIDVPDKSLADEEGTFTVVKLSSNAAYLKDGIVDGKPEKIVTPLGAPTVMKADRTPLADVTVGNGSIANIGFEFFTFKHPTFGFGCSVNLKMINVTDLVEYVGAGDSIDDDDMGFDEDVDDLSTDDDLDDDMGVEEAPTEKSNEALAEEEAQAQAASQASNVEDPDEIF